MLRNRFIGSIALLAVVTLLAISQLQAGGQGGPAPTPAQLAEYEAFRFWVSKQPVEAQRAGPEALMQRYAAELRSQGKTDADIARLKAFVPAAFPSADVERWNKILTSPNPTFNTEPNAFLVQMTRGLKPGRALDVGMGQGRNTIYLAQQGWDSVGFDPAEQAVAAARAQAAKLGVKITTHIATTADFDFGESQWDLIVLSYVPARQAVSKTVQSLRPGGTVVVEGFHRDATRTASIGSGVVFDTNELLQLFSSLRVLRYEDADGIGDFGLAQTRVVRLAAIKP